MADKGKNLTPSNTFSYSGMIMVGGMVAVLITLLIPLPTQIMDMLLACSMSLAFGVLIITLFSKEPLELSSFPSLLLFVTLFRLSLNVASTRLILLQGDAGRIIETFGSLVAGSSFVVGLVIFLILVVIQFIVITKGSERISEVSARFTLDAMPGKQMAIDADLNAGAITEAQANERRAKIVKESEFYGAMDGASKFIRGDAKAGIIITVVNILGGIAMGYTHGMTVIDSVKHYSILSIGDGLVSQIPSLVISISSGFLVTKISSKNDVAQDLSLQFLKAPQPLMIAGVLIAAMGFVPGLPPIPFLIIGAGAFITARSVAAKQKTAATETKKTDKAKDKKSDPVETLLDVDRISVNVGVRLISMVDPAKNSAIFERIGALRKRFAQQSGIIIPLVRIKDNITLEPNAYEIRLSDQPVATGKIEPGMFLAMDSGNVRNKISGIETLEPVYNLPALWITEQQKEQAQLSGYTVIDAESVFITHLSETLKKYANEILTRDDVQLLLDRLRKHQPSLVGDIIGEFVPVGTLHRVLRNLLGDNIPIRELTTVIESLGENASKTKSPTALTELTRKSLARTITQMYIDDNRKIYALTFDPHLEEQLISSVKQQGDELSLPLPAETVIQLTTNIAQAWKNAMDQAIEKIVLICDARLRKPLANLIQRSVPMLPVIAYDEIVAGSQIQPVETLKIINEDSNDLQNELVGV